MFAWSLTPHCRLTEAVVRDIVLFCWRMLSSTLATIPKDKELQSLQLLEATRSLLHVMGEFYGDDIDMAMLIAQWVDLLMGHEHHEVRTFYINVDAS